MTEESDENSIFSIAMRAVNGTQITDEHSINIDNVKLEEYVPLVTENLFNTIKNAKEIVSSKKFEKIVKEDREKLIAALNEAEKVYENAVSENPSVVQEMVDLKPIVEFIFNYRFIFISIVFLVNNIYIFSAVYLYICMLSKVINYYFRHFALYFFYHRTFR